MAVQIKGVTVSPNLVTVGQTVTVTVLAEEIDWGNLARDFTTWGEVRRSFANWNRVQNYIYSIPNPTPTVNALYTADNNALFDVDAVEISISGGGKSAYSGEVIDHFIGEVLNG